MINPKELRLGNWALYSDNNEEKEPKPVIIGVADLILIQNKVKDCEYAPIVLTPDILEKAGFTDNEYYWEKDGIELGWSSRVVATKERFGISVNGYSHIKHLHQLQNFIHALTGEELEINL